MKNDYKKLITMSRVNLLGTGGREVSTRKQDEAASVA